MNETMISITGNVATDLRFLRSERGTPLASFRLASTARRYDRSQGGWVDGRTTFVTVVCWRTLAENVAASLHKGEPILVIGRLRVEPWERDGRTGTTVEVEAQAVGHDMSRGMSAFRRTRREQSDLPSDNQVAEELARSWETVPADDAAESPGTGAAADGGRTPDRVTVRAGTDEVLVAGKADESSGVGVDATGVGIQPTHPRGGGRTLRTAAAASADAGTRAA